MKILKEITDIEFVSLFKSSDASDKSIMKVMFREWLQNRPHLEIGDTLEPEFKKLAGEILPEILKVTIKNKQAKSIVAPEKINIRAKEVLTKAPYLIREPNTKEPCGMVRFIEVVKDKNQDDYFECTVFDYIPFETEDTAEVFEKFNDEKMQMFSVVYRSYDAWNDTDTDGDYADNEDLRKAVIHVAKNGIGMNLQHDPTQPITTDDAMVIEFYQSRTAFNEAGLEVRKGDLVATTQFFDTESGNRLWGDMKSGKYTTYSMEGVSQ